MIPTDYSQIIGNESIKLYLKRMVAKKAISHSLLFAGPDGIGKSLFAHALAASIICQQDGHEKHRHKIETGNHPDIHTYRPEGKLGLHSMQSLRQFIEEVYLPPYEAPAKVLIIHEADRMLSYSANALLKTFEEPPLHTVIILLSSAPGALIPTILSRCRALHFHALSAENIGSFLQERYQLEPAAAQQLAYLADGSLARAIHLVEQGGDPNRAFLFNVLFQGKVETYKELMAIVQTLTERLEHIKKIAEGLAKSELYKVPSENLSSYQQHVIEKELEGAVTMCLFKEFNILLETILSWYRDLHLLHVNGKRDYLINKDYVAQLDIVVQRGNLLSLEYVQKAIEEVRLALQRSTSVNLCLENLFLKLQWI